MRKIFPYILAALLLCSCIENDLPYPVQVAEITGIEVDGAVFSSIDKDARTVAIVLSETSDVKAVRIKSVEYNYANTVSEPEIVSVHDLSSPETVILKTFQEYEWTLSATLPVERYFTVEGQLGFSVVDEVNRRAVAYVPSGISLTNIKITSLKLGPAGICTYSPAYASLNDFTQGAEISVSYNGSTELWKLFVEQKEQDVELNSVNAWTRCAWLTASAPDGADNGFRYRKKGDKDWTSVKDVKQEGGVFTAVIDDLLPESSYECKAFSGNEETSVTEFVTETDRQLPNGGFNAYSNAESAVYTSWFDPASKDEASRTKWWDSGNIGSTTVGSSYSIAMPDKNNKMEGSSSAYLVSRNVIVKFAAGNTFSGEFAGLVGAQGGIINFGRPWTLRPRAVRLWAKYESGIVDVVDSYPEGHTVKIGDHDSCEFWVALGDWDYHKYGGTAECPYQINTTDKSTFFNPSGESVIAYGSFVASTSSSEWTQPEVIRKADNGWVEVEIPLDYRTVARKPTHLIITFASSRYGDYFTGSSQSRLWVDDVRMVY